MFDVTFFQILKSHNTKISYITLYIIEFSYIINTITTNSQVVDF